MTWWNPLSWFRKRPNRAESMHVPPDVHTEAPKPIHIEPEPAPMPTPTEPEKSAPAPSKPAEPGILLDHVRLKNGPDYVEGELYVVEGEASRFFAFTLEDQWRDILNGEPKVHGKTCIPAGLYRVVVSMSPRFGKRMTEILGVPQFSGVRFHGGATVDHSEGCPLLGTARNGAGKIVSGGPKMTDALTALIDTPGKHYVRITDAPDWKRV